MTLHIPIRNVWLLQLYASSLYRAHGADLVAAERDPEELPDLVARILAEEVTVRLHTGLSVGFRQATRDVTRVRGRINILTTERHQLLSRGQINCTFDEIVTDTPANRLAKAALERAAALVQSQPRYRSLALQMGAAGVRGPCPPLGTASAMQRERLLGRDRRMIAAAELLLTLTIPTTESGNQMLPLPFLGDHYLRKLFEHAAYGFYGHRLGSQGWDVQHGKRLSWDISRQSSGMAAVLPGMTLDIRLRHSDPSGAGPRQIVIDTKFTSVTKANQFGQETLSSGHVYQIYAYLMSQDGSEAGTKSEGLMLHPVVDGNLDEEVVIQGHRIRFATVDLAAAPDEMAQQFLKAVNEFIPPT
ncbi:5-methylcytosine restriction system specificity protein McrC [Terracoccus luteus]|uniref:5-methylcytosine-specific restriction enzyme subunit McrC n=1 Tax=Terracoccus luteus TaxID=53356 RepID=A0A839PW95_9MICO|nr:5-methylcytosine-specific restriction endonuclease system specificity protein McrC [Terracoccus luteus]MBB2988518.1 5-methylcytosine-specific restriction enzyme subunit McrC [Terracoccus luteus]MCP2174171.1 5-methylcytosine-specific restriction enzyme subunit McrC [Terracoccus luteus]